MLIPFFFSNDLSLFYFFSFVAIVLYCGNLSSSLVSVIIVWILSYSSAIVVCLSVSSLVILRKDWLRLWCNIERQMFFGFACEKKLMPSILSLHHLVINKYVCMHRHIKRRNNNNICKEGIHFVGSEECTIYFWETISFCVSVGVKSGNVKQSRKL